MSEPATGDPRVYLYVSRSELFIALINFDELSGFFFVL